MANLKAYLPVLQRSDPGVVDILGHAGHVVLYQFSTPEQAWARKEIEGPLFIVKRDAEPRFRMVVMNRLSTENLVQEIDLQFQAEVMDAYLIYRGQDKPPSTDGKAAAAGAAGGKKKKGAAAAAGAPKSINGIWFFKPEEREECAAVVRKVTKALARVAEALAAQQGGGGGGGGAAAALSAGAIAGAVTGAVAGGGGGGMVDKAALGAAIVGLCQNDGFLSMVHKAYVRELQGRLQQKQQQAAAAAAKKS